MVGILAKSCELYIQRNVDFAVIIAFSKLKRKLSDCPFIFLEVFDCLVWLQEGHLQVTSSSGACCRPRSQLIVYPNCFCSLRTVKFFLYQRWQKKNICPKMYQFYCPNAQPDYFRIRKTIVC